MSSTAAGSSSSSSLSSESMALNLATAKTIITTIGSVAATVVVARTLARDLLPDEIQSYLSSAFYSVFRRFSSQLTLVVDEFHGLESNHVYESAAFYLGAKTRADASSSSSNCSSAARRLKVTKAQTEDGIYVDVEPGEEIVDEFDGVKFHWILVSRQMERNRGFHNPRDMNSTLRSEVRNFELSFHKRHKRKAIEEYLPYIIDRSREMKEMAKTIKIYSTNATSIEDDYGDIWEGVNLNHPSTFETLAMDAAEKQQVIEDLERFVKRREYYRRVGKAWKRGYLLYGPPGTGKSSLIAAMANHLKFDIYDLELTSLRKNSDLRKVLLATANRSILVIEDIDCSINLQNRIDHRTESRSEDDDDDQNNNNNKRQVTLSGILNFIDGLWSSCGDERIIIFTTNYKDRLDPALLRPGRMDLHIHMSYCTPTSFEILAKNYLGLRIKSHFLFDEINRLIESVQVTPAAVAEQLMRSDDVDTALTGLIDFLIENYSQSHKNNNNNKNEEFEIESAKKEDKNEGTVLAEDVGLDPIPIPFPIPIPIPIDQRRKR